jgi:NTE family protein
VSRRVRPVARAGGPTVAVVLSGAAARGAFQAGALAELIPALERDGLRPTVWLGTSAGSINAVLWGAAAHLEAAVAGEEVLGVWRRMSDRNVYRLNPAAGWDYAYGALLGIGPGATSLLDTGPLHRSAAENLRTGKLKANVKDGLLAAVGVVATRMAADSGSSVAGAASGRSVLFLDEHLSGEYDGDPERALDVVRGTLTAGHVLASSAIPVAFPPVRVTDPASAAGWYVDGGVRLNTPLHPAVGLGATKIVVVSATPLAYDPPPPPDRTGRTPDIADAGAQVLNAVLADRTIEDLRALRRTNRLVAQAYDVDPAQPLTGSTGQPYRTIEVMTVSPPPGEMGRRAARVFDRRVSGLGRWSELDNWLLGRAIRGAGDGVGRRELLSYLFFDREYFASGIELGRMMAKRALSQGWTR